MTPRLNSTTKAGGANRTPVSFAMEGADFDPDISPDGRRLVYASTQHRMTSDIYVKTIDSRVVSQLTSDPANDVMPRRRLCLQPRRQLGHLRDAHQRRAGDPAHEQLSR
jgi:hypothetical protein